MIFKNLSGTGTRVFNFDNGSSRANIKLQSDIEFSGNIEGNTFYQNEYNVNAEEGIISVNNYYGKTTDGINGKVGLINIGEEGFSSRLYYDINAGVLKINGKATMYSKMNLDGDLFIVEKGELNRYSGSYDLSITGNIQNNGNITSYVNLSWNNSGDNNYVLNISGHNPINIFNSNKYRINNSILNENDNIYWNVLDSYGNYIVNQKCINVPGCVIIPGEGGNNGIVGPIENPYSNSFFSNDSPMVYNNYPSKEYIIENSLKYFDYNYSKNISSENIISKSDEGDPVILNTGEFVYDNTLMYFPGKGIPFSLDVHYKNRSYYNGVIGYNWDHNYNLFIIENSNGNVSFHNGKLGVSEFEKTGTGFLYNDSINSELTYENNKYVLNQNNEKIITFGDNNRVESISDKYGNKLYFYYNSDGQLISVTDTLGRDYVFSYYNHSRIKDITDFLGNKIEFIYFGDLENEGDLYDLKTIKTINSASTRDIGFTYTKSENFDDSHNIIKLIDSENNVYVENEYDENDRVKTQKFGNGIITYDYTLNNNGGVSQNKVNNRLGNETTYYYDEKGNTIKKVVHKITGDVVYLYEYNDNNKLIKETKPLGNGITYEYDQNGNVTEKRLKADLNAENSSDDIVVSTVYNLDWNKPIKITSSNGLVTNFVLDNNGNFIKKETLGVIDFENNSLNIIEEYNYNSDGELIKKIDSGLLETTYEYLSGSLVKTIKGTGSGTIITEFEYDNKGNIISVIDGEGNKTIMNYNDFNLLTKQTTPEGIINESEYNNLNKKINERIILSDTNSVNISYQYDILDNPIKTITDIDSQRKNTLVTKYDNDSRIIETQNSNGAISKFEYNETNQITKKTVIVGNQSIVTNYEYDLNDNLIKETSANGAITNYEYDLHGRLIKQTYPDDTYAIFVNDKSGNTLETKKYSSSGVLLYRETAEYDLLNRVIVLNKYILNSNEKIITTKVKYNSFGNIVESYDEKNRKTEFIYDNFHRLIETIESSGNKIIQEYNKNDEIITKKIISTDGKVITTQYLYDKDSRMTRQIDTNGDFEEFEYNNLNQVVSKTDKKGNITEYKYDYKGNLLEEKQSNKITKYEYDERGNMIKLIDSNNNETIYEYDGLNRLIKRIYPDGNFASFEYDSLGNIIKSTDPNGTIINNTYDISGRLVSREIIPANGTIGVTSESYIYDDLGRLIEANDSQNNLIKFEYDSLNRLTKELNGGEEIIYSYDDLGNIVKIIYPDGREINRSFDNQDRITEILSGNTQLVNYTYDSFGLTNKSYSNNTNTDYTYDNLLNLSSLNSQTASGTTISDFSYTYDKNGNILSDGTQNYIYDVYNRVKKVEYSDTLSEEFIFDNMGNRDTVTISNSGSLSNTFYQNNNLNQVTNTGTGTNIESYEYDNNGNLKQDTNYKYVYDYKNRLTKVTDLSDNNIVEYGYDVLGRRTSKTLNNGETYEYIYSDNQKIVETKTNNGVLLKKEYIYGDRIDDILAVYSEEILGELENEQELGFCVRVVNPNREDFLKYNHQTIINRCDTLNENISTTTKLYFYHKNHLGSIIGITNNNGEIVESYDYDIYGNIQNYQDSIIGNNIYYTGREYEKEIELYYNRARYYSPKLGRFIGRDSIDIADDINLYAYVGNNPVMFVDLMGTEKKWIKKNEGNAWYFDNADGYGGGNSGFELGHAALYFIYHGNEYLVSYYPTNATDTSGSGEGDMFFGKVDAVSGNGDYNGELVNFGKHARGIEKYGDFNSINIKSDKYNSTELYNWYEKEYLELPKYNTFSNNCSDEVRKGLVASGYLEEKNIINQISTFGLINIDTPLSLRKEILNK